MSHTLTLPDELYVKLVRGAAQRGLTLESLLACVSDLVLPAEQPTPQDRERGRIIERLFAKSSSGRLTNQDRVQLDRLIDKEYQEACRRADRLIAQKKQRDEKSPSARAVEKPGTKRSQK
jgi:hypothetical protein